MNMNNLAKLTNDTPMIYARKVAREFELTTREEAIELIHIFTSNGEKNIEEVIDELKRCIKTYEGLLRVKASRGEREESVERSMAIWKQELKQMESAMKMVNTPKGVH
jgi:hypothetical protein